MVEMVPAVRMVLPAGQIQLQVEMVQPDLLWLQHSLAAILYLLMGQMEQAVQAVPAVLVAVAVHMIMVVVMQPVMEEMVVPAAAAAAKEAKVRMVVVVHLEFSLQIVQ
jgi:hypothetical protein